MYHTIFIKVSRTNQVYYSVINRNSNVVKPGLKLFDSISSAWDSEGLLYNVSLYSDDFENRVIIKEEVAECEHVDVLTGQMFCNGIMQSIKLCQKCKCIVDISDEEYAVSHTPLWVRRSFLKHGLKTTDKLLFLDDEERFLSLSATIKKHLVNYFSNYYDGDFDILDKTNFDINSAGEIVGNIEFEVKSNVNENSCSIILCIGNVTGVLNEYGVPLDSNSYSYVVYVKSNNVNQFEPDSLFIDSLKLYLFRRLSSATAKVYYVDTDNHFQLYQNLTTYTTFQKEIELVLSNNIVSVFDALRDNVAGQITMLSSDEYFCSRKQGNYKSWIDFTHNTSKYRLQLSYLNHFGLFSVDFFSLDGIDHEVYSDHDECLNEYCVYLSYYCSELDSAFIDIISNNIFEIKDFLI